MPEKTQPTQPPYPLHPSILSRLAPDYATFYNTHLLNAQQSHLQPISISRASRPPYPGSGPLQPVASTTDLTIPRSDPPIPIPIRVFTPLGSPPPAGWPVCIYIHGGGWVLGDIHAENVLASHLCARGGAVVISVDYRLAPEAPFPAAVEDCWGVVLWVRDKGKEVLGVDAERMAVAGCSAGANLAAVMCQRALQLLVVPVVDNTAGEGDEKYASWRENALMPGLTPEKMRWYRGLYLPRREDWEHPEASPVLALVVLGGADILRGEGEAFGRRLGEAGVRVEVRVVEGQPHPFVGLDGVLEGAREVIGRLCEVLKGVM
ncbi:Alpha/Beta hydrolase protein [Cercophora newfieldiana]|uniref:Alpha/Beta hydrolase protein n=1 Tax=Cercophora newfieldiana TaxID=92897 RepID=A0AA40CNY3_9PEZI|nr:Alpha/Beta hydrolase protein [Cercophora newfieldiana]